MSFAKLDAAAAEMDRQRHLKALDAPLRAEDYAFQSSWVAETYAEGEGQRPKMSAHEARERKRARDTAYRAKMKGVML